MQQNELHVLDVSKKNLTPVRFAVRRTVNVGILAHIDAGKTTLSERLLFDTGAIQSFGSVDAGTTTTDSGELERERGITIRSAVAPFVIDDLQVNLIDTPGHPDFIAEVDRALSVLDAVIIVVSAVEGIQAQTKVLMRSIQKLGLPVIFFINKVDRMGARPDSVFNDIGSKLTPKVVKMSAVENSGRADAIVIDASVLSAQWRKETSEKIAEVSENFLQKYLSSNTTDFDEMIDELGQQCKLGELYPVFMGSALKGIGIKRVLEGIRDMFPSHAKSNSGNGEPIGSVFAIKRTSMGRCAYVSLSSGQISERDVITFSQIDTDDVWRTHKMKAAKIIVVAPSSKGPLSVNSNQQGRTIRPGEIGMVWGLMNVRVGAQIGVGGDGITKHNFLPPTMESVVTCGDVNRTKLSTALKELADEDPLIQTHVNGNGELSVLLYGEVQREVIQERLIREFGVSSEFSAPRPIYIERPTRIGNAYFEYNPMTPNIFWATVGIRIEPGEVGTGNVFIIEEKKGLMPVAFYKAIEESALETLRQGVFGWRVIDCRITLTKVGFASPITVAAHFRYLTRIVVLRALQDAKSRVFESYSEFELELPKDSLGAVLAELSTKHATVESTLAISSTSWCVKGAIPTKLVHQLVQNLPNLTRGEASFVVINMVDSAVKTAAPLRARSDGNPLDYDNYVKFLHRNNLL